MSESQGVVVAKNWRLRKAVRLDYVGGSARERFKHLVAGAEISPTEVDRVMAAMFATRPTWEDKPTQAVPRGVVVEKLRPSTPSSRSS